MSKPVWGIPWHGLVQGGQLTLPNGQALPWLQPTDTVNGANKDYAGYTYKQKLPGVPEVVRTEEEQAADAGAGHQWRNSFIVAGTDDLSGPSSVIANQVHGKRIGGWIYAAPDGSRWVIRMGGNYGWNQGGSLNIGWRVIRFGEFQGPAQTITPPTLSISTAAMGQGSPSLPHPTYRAKVEDITPDGSQAIIRLYLQDTGKPAVGFLKLTLTGTPGDDFAASLSLLKSRAQTLGLQVDDQTVSLAYFYAGHQLETETNDTRGSYPNCGYIDNIFTPTQALLPEGPEVAANCVIASGQNRFEQQGRIIAMWFDANGVPQPLLMDSVQTYTLDAPEPEVTVSGRSVWREPWLAQGVCIQQPGYGAEYMTGEWVGTLTEIVEQTITLRYGAETVTHTLRVERIVNVSASFTGPGGAWQAAPIAASGNKTDEYTATLNGQQVWSYADNGAWSYGARMPLPSVQTFLAGAAGMPVWSGRIGITWTPSIYRWSNNLIGWRTFYNYNLGAGPGYELSPAFTPMGLQPPESVNAVGQYGAFNPVTGECLFPSDTPVSWT